LSFFSGGEGLSPRFREMHGKIYNLIRKWLLCEKIMMPLYKLAKKINIRR